MKQLLAFCLILIFSTSYSQVADSSLLIQLPATTVTGYREKSSTQTSLNIESLNIESLSNFGNFNLTDLMTRTPGVDRLSIGVAIVEPVIGALRKPCTESYFRPEVR